MQEHINNTNKSHSNNNYLKQSYEMKSRIVNSLTNLLNSFDVTAEEAKERHNLCYNIQKELDLSNISRFLEQTNHFVTSLQSDAKEKQKSFFDQVFKQVSSINAFFIKESQLIIKTHSTDINFQTTLQCNLDEMTESLNSTDSLEDIRFKLMKTINSVNTNLNEYKSIKDSQIECMNSKIDNYVSKIDRLKSDYREMASHFNDKMQELNIEAKTDPLTKLLNRSGYDSTLQNMFSEYLNKKGEDHLNFVICDIDLFKSINDEYGHDAGDKVLVKIAEILSAGVRSHDAVCRFGGEEFAILMPNSYYTDCLKVIERLRTSIENTAFSYSNKPLKITCSFGLAYFSTEDIPSDVMKRADEALYESKRKGRNIVYLNDPIEHNGLISYNDLVK